MECRVRVPASCAGGVDTTLSTNCIDGVLQEDHRTLNLDGEPENKYLSIDYKMFVPYIYT